MKTLNVTRSILFRTLFTALYATLFTLIAPSAKANENVEYYHQEAPKAQLAQRPAVPKLTSPAPLATVAAEGLLLQWATVETATAYALQVSDDANFYHLLVDEPLLKESSYTIKNLSLTSGKNYYWRVASVSENNQNGYIKSLFNRSSFTLK